MVYVDLKTSTHNLTTTCRTNARHLDNPPVPIHPAFDQYMFDPYMFCLPINTCLIGKKTHIIQMQGTCQIHVRYTKEKHWVLIKQPNNQALATHQIHICYTSNTPQIDRKYIPEAQIQVKHSYAYNTPKSTLLLFTTAICVLA